MEIVHTLLFPIILAMENLYRQGYDISLNAGFSIILMSLFFNFLILPFYYISESGRNTVQALQDKMADEVSSIKQYYKGRERHYYLKAIQKRYGFNHTMALKASAGTLIQIPFFLAAYYYLTHKETLVGTSFGLINDLSEPDTLLFGTALLPWCMIATNLLSAHFYTGQNTAKHKWQLWLMAVAFFAFLYNEASAMLLYWTSSNIFSLVKNVTEKVLAKFSFIQHIRVWCLRLLVRVDLIYKKRLMAAMVISLLFIISIFIFFYLEVNTANLNISLFWFNFLTWGALGLVVWRISYQPGKQQPNAAFKALVQFFLLFALMTVIIIVITWLLSESNKIVITTNLRNNAILSLVCINLLLVFWLITNRISFFAKLQVPSYIFAVSILALTLLMFVINPLLFFISTDEFVLQSNILITSSLGLVAAISLWGYTGYLALHPNWRGLVFFTTFLLLVLALTYSFIISRDYGLMTQFAFDSGAVLSQGWLYSIVEAILLIVVAICVYIFLVKFPKALFACLLGILVMMSSFIVINLPKNSHAQIASTSGSISGEVDAIPESSPFHAYSTDRNVLIFMLDAFSGTVLDYLLKQDLDSFEAYQGFVWYKNTLSTSLSTWSSIGEMVGGSNYSVEAINKRNNKTIQEELNDAYNVLPQAFLPSDWDISYYNAQYASKISEWVNVTSFDYAKYYLQTHQRKLYVNEGKLNEKNMLYMASLFRASPLMLKLSIYDNGKWIGAMGKNEKLLKVYNKAKSWGFMKAMESEMHKTSVKPTLKFVQFQLPHRPNLVNSKGKLQVESLPFVIESKVVLLQIANILEKMKMLGIYDNSKIILVSDHGYYYDYMQYIQYDGGFVEDFTDSLPNDPPSRLRPSRLQALLMVKDFNTVGGIQTSDKFMSNGDLLAIICVVLQNNCGKNIPDPTKKHLDRELSISYTLRPSYESDKKYKIISNYQVKNNIFDPTNWKEITQ